MLREEASYRDPSGTVFYVDDRVYRGLDAVGLANWTALSTTKFFDAGVKYGSLVATSQAPPESVGISDYAAVLEHERIPFISYPYEWSFEMLRDAAATHLDLLRSSLEEDLTMKDGYSFNMQFRGAQPVFIDIGSFEPVAAGPWIGYRQFCQSFLYPLLLEAHLGVPFQRFLIGHLEGLEPSEMRRIFTGRKRFRKGVFKHVFLHSVAESNVTGGGRDIQRDLGKQGFSKELTKATAKKLSQLIGSLRSRRADSGWKSYRETCSYSDADRDAKEQLVTSVVESRDLNLVWDLGANDGAYARIAAQHAKYVVACDSDDVTVDAMYRSLRADGVSNVLPLVMNVMDPSPARGWRGLERRAFSDRGRPDLVMALALIHHLAIASNVPLPEVVAWMREFDAPLIVEFVESHDPMAARLLANKPEGQFPDYRIDVFEKLLSEAYSITQSVRLPSGSRTLYVVEPR